MLYEPREEKDILMERVATGDVQKLRAYLEDSFWQKTPAQPKWKHLQAALKTGKRDMVRLLVTYHARPTMDDLEKLKTQAGDDYPQYLRLLRQAGLPLSLTAFESYAQKIETGLKQKEQARLETEKELQALEAAHQSKIDAIPQEWRNVLSALQQTGAPEAVIAGGALRDLFNKRQVKDVDIFLKTQGSDKKNRKFLAQAFKAAQVKVAEQITGNGFYGSVLRETFPDPKMQTFIHLLEDDYFHLTAKNRVDSWTVLAGPEKTEYNIVFLSEEMAKAMHAPKDKPVRAGGLLAAFDFGLCQIAFDGKKVATTSLYEADVAQKRLTLSKGNESSKEHLERIMKKYPDWALDDGAKKLLVKKPAPHRGGYRFY